MFFSFHVPPTTCIYTFLSFFPHTLKQHAHTTNNNYQQQLQHPVPLSMVFSPITTNNNYNNKCNNKYNNPHSLRNCCLGVVSRRSGVVHKNMLQTNKHNSNRNAIITTTGANKYNTTDAITQNKANNKQQHQTTILHNNNKNNDTNKNNNNKQHICEYLTSKCCFMCACNHECLVCMLRCGDVILCCDGFVRCNRCVVFPPFNPWEYSVVLRIPTISSYHLFSKIFDLIYPPKRVKTENFPCKGV